MNWHIYWKGGGNMEQPVYQNVLHLADYGAPYEGNFVASLRALETSLAARAHGMAYVFPVRAGNRDWARAMQREKPNVHILENDGFFAYMRQIRRLLRNSKIDILHVHFIHYKEKIASLLAARTCGRRVKLVVHLHNHLRLPDTKLRALPQRFYLLCADRFVCCSRSVADRLIADGVPQDKVYIAENAIAFPRLDDWRPLSRAELGVSASARTVLMFGFDFLRKGVDIALGAVRLLREERNLDIALCIVLSSRREQVEKEILQRLDVPVLPDWIVLLPPRSDVGSYYHFADVFISPSREEGFCYALVEAAYCETPVAASAIAAQRDLQLPESSFCRPEDTQSLSDTILRQMSLFEKCADSDALRAAKERVIAAYSLSSWADAVLTAYDSLFVR